jgi:predicted nuclease of predicted toxin-antitoxin system
MALRLLLEAHLDKAIAETLQRQGIDALSLARWRAGAFLSASDHELLLAAQSDNRALVTFDVSTIPGELERLFLEHQDHAGVIYVSFKTFRPNDVGGIVAALSRLANEQESLANSTCWLPANP